MCKRSGMGLLRKGNTMSDLIKQIEELTLRCDSSTLLPIIERVEKLQSELEAAQVDQRLIEELWQRRTDASEANARIRELLGDTEQLKLTVARLTENLRRMDAIVTLAYVSIEKRKLREAETP